MLESPVHGPHRPHPRATAAAAAFVRQVEVEGVPEWVERIAGPVRDVGLRVTLTEFLSDAPLLICTVSFPFLLQQFFFCRTCADAQAASDITLVVGRFEILIAYDQLSKDEI